MKINIARDARPQAKTLLLAALLTIALWFIPFAGYATYPFRLFVTFIHEGGHALAALATGNHVHSLQIMLDGSGVTYTTRGGLISDFIVSSAGYVGAMAFGALLLLLIRRTIAARVVLLGTAGLILTLTIAYGLFSLFTLASGVLLAGGLIAVAKYGSPRAANFTVSFLAVQCVLNALADLKTVFYLSSPFGPGAQTDAANMAAATGVPAIFWSVFWIGLAFVILSLALRAYTLNSRRADRQPDLPFEDPLGV